MLRATKTRCFSIVLIETIDNLAALLAERKDYFRSPATNATEEHRSAADETTARGEAIKGRGRFGRTRAPRFNHCHRNETISNFSIEHQ
ncbi:protein of unknown function [Methylocella tundrae]|uniref:Uncharacterized protein n=1 Tax=Methylocella tundrae TaxID=227605 RepID=A0A4U8Z4S8_METTU|nr:protein of unknown function [Methylocella tundrae]